MEDWEVILDAERINVKQYGALGNGVTDDTAAIQKAVNDCISNKGSVLVFPFATYKITAPIIITKATKIYIEGNGSVIKGNRHDLFRIEDTTHFHVHRLFYELPASGGTVRFLRGIRMSYVSLIDCHVKNGALAFFLSAYDGTPIDYNDKSFWNQFIRLARCTASAAYLADNIVMCQKANNVVIEQCLLEKGTGDGIKFNGGDCENLYIAYNEIRYMDGDGVDMFGSGRYLHIHDNYFNNISGYPANLKLSGDENNQGGTTFKAWFVNNRVENNALALGLANGKNILVQGNIFKANGIDPKDGTKYSHLIHVSESAEDIRFIDNDFFENNAKQSVITFEQVGTGMDLYSLVQGNRFRKNTSPYQVYLGKSDSTANRRFDINNNLFDGIPDKAIVVQITKGSVAIRNNRFINGKDAIRIMTLTAPSKVFALGNISEVTGSNISNSTKVKVFEADNSWNFS